MAVRHSRAVQRLSSATRPTESRLGRIGPISLDVKQMGERSAGNPHAAFDAEGAGNVAGSCPVPDLRLEFIEGFWRDAPLAPVIRDAEPQELALLRLRHRAFRLVDPQPASGSGTG